MIKMSELQAQENQLEVLTIPEAVAKFLTDIKSGHSPATERTYRFVLRHFCRYLTTIILAAPATSQLSPTLPPDTIPVSKLQTDWAINFMRQLATGQLRADQAADNSSSKIGADTNKSPLRNSVKIGADTKLMAVPKSTLAVYAAALMRFYRWCSVERLVLMSADEFERLAIRLRELRGRQKQTIIDKVPADEVIEALLKQARANLAVLVEQPNEPQIEDDRSKNAANITISGNAAANLTQPKTALSKYDALHHRLQLLRNLALVETLKATGARVSEITSLTRGNLDAANRRARVVGKGSKERWVYFSTSAWDTIQSYLQTRNRLLAQASQGDDQLNNEIEISENAEQQPKLQKSRKKTVRLKSAEIAQQPVFARHDRGAGVKQVKPLTPRSVQKILWELVEAVEDEDLPLYITPHKFRHWFATKVLAATGDLAVTQDLLGHANPATTRIYAQVSETRKQEAHRQLFESQF